MDQQKVDMFMMVNNKYFPESQLTVSIWAILVWALVS